MAGDQKKRPRTAETAGGMNTREDTRMSARKGNRAPGRGHRVAQARHRAGLTQPQLAEKAGISRPTIARIESSGHAPSVTIALAIARELGEPVEALFGGGR